MDEPTPRTDREDGWAANDNGERAHVVLASFARTLERALARAISERDKLLAERDTAIDEGQAVATELAALQHDVTRLMATVSEVEAERGLIEAMALERAAEACNGLRYGHALVGATDCRAAILALSPGAAAAELARLRACEKDAGRYQWLREQQITAAEVIVTNSAGVRVSGWKKGIDTAIDEARAAIEKGALQGPAPSDAPRSSTPRAGTYTTYNDYSDD